MKVHNTSDDSQFAIIDENNIEKTQNIQFYPEPSFKKLHKNHQQSQKDQIQEKPSELQNPMKENKIPETMKIFLKQKRLTLQFLEGESQNQHKNSQNQKKRSLNLAHKKSQKQKKVQLKSLKAMKSLEQTAETLNQDSAYQAEQICKICEGKISLKMLKQQVFDCGHAFCEECTKSYVQYKIKMFEQIYCPNQNCKGSLNQKNQFYCTKISLKQRKQYIKIHRFFEIHKSAEAKRLCPKNQCDGIIMIDFNLPANKCPTCDFEICPKCLAQVHPGECEDYETKFLKQNFNLVKCDKCKNFIEKSEGCHHISCKCGYEFCQKCKLPWTKRHICKYTGLERAQQGWGGCDWGITTRDHVMFLLKLPLKFLLIIVFVLGWTLFSFLGAPLNIVMFIYWLFLLFVKPSIQNVKREENCWKILAYAVFFPFFMVANLCEGYGYLIDHIDQLMPEISNSFRWIVRL